MRSRLCWEPAEEESRVLRKLTGSLLLPNVLFNSFMAKNKLELTE